LRVGGILGGSGLVVIMDGAIGVGVQSWLMDVRQPAVILSQAMSRRGAA
jgi:hypothetical protein